MYIQRLKLMNFRCFQGEVVLDFKPGLNYFVGNNNCGKTTIFRAIQFLKSNGDKEKNLNKSCSSDAELSVELVLGGNDIKEIIKNDESLQKLSDYVSNENTLTLLRTSKSLEWTDSKNKIKRTEQKNLLILNPEIGVFENPTGIDKVAASVLDSQFVFSDLSVEEYQDFSKARLLGKIIDTATNEIRNSSIWINLMEAHKATFEGDEFKTAIKSIEADLERLLLDQYGESKINIQFTLPAEDSFMKNGTIQVTDNGVETEIKEKGTGMQRAFALSLIQLYATLQRNNFPSQKRPVFFFIDEPETFLHPVAQDKLLGSLSSLASSSQIFITTHSPYLLRNFDSKNHALKVFKRIYQEGDSSASAFSKVEISDGDLCRINSNDFGPSWAAINYFAFGLPSVELHIELFGELHKLLKGKNGVGAKISSVDQYFATLSGIPKTDGCHINTLDGSNCPVKADKTMPVYIRNFIDHPGELPYRKKPTIDEIAESIKFMFSLYQTLI
ncbi:ATP-dependent nuclease [Actinomyces vulturis]|uniref:ATP-dependent nuclease n=1 Tax=Actinomyces vulturis TaxID=1857645 RepID=UPI0009F37E2C|nr:AAA family ATPase [Actinomyces vulturis]